MGALGPTDRSPLGGSPSQSPAAPTIALPSRRAVLCAVCAAAATAVAPAQAAEPANPRDMLAQPGDLLASFKEGKAGPLIDPAAVKRDAAQLLAWPYDPKSKTARDGSRLNLVLLMHFDPADLSPDEKPRAANGIVAYTAVCTHQGCWVTGWRASQKLLHCPCHGSEYDPRRGAAVARGPAPRALPALPLRIAAGRLEVAGPFSDRVGAETPSGL